jgi:hypothetical protein
MDTTTIVPSIKVRTQLPKTKLFELFKPNPKLRRSFDEQISKLVIIGEISSQTTNIEPGETIPLIYLTLVDLKSRECSPANIEFLAKNIKQTMIFILHYEGDAQLAVYVKDRVVFSEWKAKSAWKFPIRGHDLDAAYLHLANRVANSDASSIEELHEILVRQEQIARLEKQIKILDQKTLKESQPKRKWGLHERTKQLRKELEDITHG